MSLYKRPGSQVWHYEFVLGGVRFRGSTRETSRSRAERVEQSARAAAANAPAGPTAPDPTLNKLFGRYEAEHLNRLPSAKQTGSKLAMLVEGLGENTLVSLLNDQVIAEYVAKRRGVVCDQTVNRDLTTLRAVLRRAADLWSVPEPKIKWASHRLTEPEERSRHLSADEQRRLFAALRPDFHPMVRFALATGVRAQNALQLTWSQVDFDARQLEMRTKSKRPGGSIRTVPLTDSLVALLANESGKHPTRVFTYLPEKKRGLRRAGEPCPFSIGGWAAAWRKALKDAGISDFRFHDLRHTTGTRVLRATGNLKAVKEVLGHRDIKSTMRYAHLDTADIRRAMEAAAALDPTHPSAPPPKRRPHEIPHSARAATVKRRK